MIRIILGILLIIGLSNQFVLSEAPTFESSAGMTGYITAQIAFVALAIWLIYSGITKGRTRKDLKSHPILAAFLDYYFISLIGLGLISLSNSVSNMVILSPTAIIVIFVLILLGIILYHAWLNKKTKFLSYGEIVAGKVLSKGKKEWKNPYKKSRIFLFIVILLGLLLIGNTWNNVMFIVPKLTFVIAGFIKVLVVFLGIYLIGRGKIKGVFISMIPYILGAFFSLMFLRVASDSIFLVMLILFTIVTMGYVACFFYYRDIKK